MFSEIKIIESMKLIGISAEMSLVENTTFNLFRKFMPRRQEIQHRKSNFVLDLKLYPDGYFENFHPANSFTKWAAVEVLSWEHVPEGMATFVLPAGRYAVFVDTNPGKDSSIFKYIFAEWLPESNYLLDNRPHFDLIQEMVVPDRALAEDLICIPVKQRES